MHLYLFIVCFHPKEHELNKGKDFLLFIAESPVSRLVTMVIISQMEGTWDMEEHIRLR